MKKIILGVAMLIGFISFSNAQNAAPAKSGTKKAPEKHVAASQTVTQPAHKPATATAPTSTTKKMSTTPAAASAPAATVKHDAAHNKKAPVKKDGTPDTKHKENKKS
jgi:hypothetical protein